MLRGGILGGEPLFHHLGFHHVPRHTAERKSLEIHRPPHHPNRPALLAGSVHLSGIGQLFQPERVFIHVFHTARGGENLPPFYGYAYWFVGWTLNYELFFYLLFFGSLFLHKYRFAALFVVFALLHALYIHFTGAPLLQSFNPHLMMPAVRSAYLSMAMNPMVLLFGAGILMGYLYKSSRSLNPACDLVSFAAAATRIVLLLIRPQFDGHGVWTSLFCLLVFVAGLSLERLLTNSPTAMTAVRPLVYLGNISYSIYLLHPIFASESIQQPLSPMPCPLRIAVLLGLICITAAVSYELIEKRFSGYLKRKLGL